MASPGSHLPVGVSLLDVYSDSTAANGRPPSGPTPLVPSAIVLQLPPRGPRWITISNLPGSSPAPPTGVRQPDLRPALPLGVALRVVVSALQHYQRCPGLISEHLHRGTPPGSLGLQSLCLQQTSKRSAPDYWPVARLMIAIRPCVPEGCCVRLWPAVPSP